MARSQRIELRVTPEEKGLLKVLAERHHTDLAGWIRQRIFSDESFAPGEVVPYRPEKATRPAVVASPRASVPMERGFHPALSSACPEHPAAGTTEVRGKLYCAEPGCPRLVKA